LTARLALVRHHLRQGDTESALNAALAADAAMPDNLDLLDLLGQCQARMGQTSQALASFGRMTTLAPKSAAGHLGMAGVYLDNRQYDVAARSIQRALELSPDSEAAHTLAVRAALGRRDAAQAIEIARRLQADQPALAAGFVLEGEVQFQQQQWAAAAAVLRKALDKTAPGGASALLYRALARGDRPGDAEQFAAQRLAAHPHDAALLFAQADAARQRGDLTDATRRFERLLAWQPEHLPALNNLALVQLAGRQPEALATARRAAALAPRQPAVLDTLAQALAADGSLADAITAQRDAAGLAPDQPDYRLALVRLLLRNGEKAEARQQLTRLAALGAGFARQAEVSELLLGIGTPAR
jgi:tetratricopeptide (TPR) repeat protein